MYRQARTGNTVLVNSREMTGRTQTLSLGLGGGGEGVKTTEKNVGPVVRCHSHPFLSHTHTHKRIVVVHCQLSRSVPSHTSMSETANATLQEAVDTRVQPAVATFLRRQYRSAHRNQRRRRESFRIFPFGSGHVLHCMLV
jgi:hypothetical protein